MFNSIKVLSLDAMGTLIKLRESPGSLYSRAFKDIYGIADVDQKLLDKRFKEAFRLLEVEEPCYSFSSKGPEYWWKCVIKRTFDDYANVIEKNNVDMDAFCHFLYDYYSTTGPWMVTERNLLDRLDNLRFRAGVHIVVTSNFDFRLKRLLTDFGFGKIDAWFLSGELGVAKPDVEIFRHIARRFAINNPSEILHVGDNTERDYAAARNFGAQAALYRPDQVNDDPTLTVSHNNSSYKITADEIVNSIFDLCSKINR